MYKPQLRERVFFVLPSGEKLEGIVISCHDEKRTASLKIGGSQFIGVSYSQLMPGPTNVTPLRPRMAAEDTAWRNFLRFLRRARPASLGH